MEYEKRAFLLPAYSKDADLSDDEIRTSGVYRLQSGEIKALHYHSYAEIGFCLCGSGEDHIGDRVYRYKSGDIQYVPPFMPHLASSDEGVCSEWIWLDFHPLNYVLASGVKYAEGIEELEKRSFYGVFSPDERGRLATLFTSLLELCRERDAFFKLKCTALCIEISTELLKLCDTGTDLPINEQGRRSRIAPAISYIRENYADPTKTSEKAIAEVCSLSVSHFRALFKQEAGVTLQEFLLKSRIAKAAYLLRTRDTGILTVALESGFNDVSHFNRSFRRYYGMTPSEYKKSKRR